MIPFYSGVQSIKNHVDNYLLNWQHQMDAVFVTSQNTVDAPTPFDRSNFYLCDNLPYQMIEIAEGIHGEYLLTEISPSRALSFSLFIDPLVQLKSDLCLDQRIELGFVCCFLSTPFWFDKTMTDLINRHRDVLDPFNFGIHPFFDWAMATVFTFGNFQGGPHKRWSPCGGEVSVLEIFGAQEQATEAQRLVGESKLSSIVNHLYHHLCWVDSLLGMGEDPMKNLSMSFVSKQVDKVCLDINSVAPCQLGSFRLGIFTTILIGCGELKQGKHLRQLMFPVKGCASYNHLANTMMDRMSSDHAFAIGTDQEGTSIANDGDDPIAVHHQDRAMQLLSVALGRDQYFRDEIECLLVSEGGQMSTYYATPTLGCFILYLVLYRYRYVSNC
jgi:hypothetical protein